MKAATLSPQARAEALRAMSEDEPLDVLVIGGGVVGAGTALDAATRGLRVGIVEARDWASGTSSRSTKLIHGGLRYLEMFDFKLVREALLDRALLLQKIAPHLVRPVPFLYPLTHHVWERPYVGAGLTLYDTMGLSRRNPRGLPRHRHYSRRGALAQFPDLRPDVLVGGVQFWEAQVDDARHTMTIVRTAVGYGALAANRTRAVELLRDGRRVTGARVEDLETGAQYTISARVVINATGVWSGDIDALAGGHDSIHVRASKGIHIVVPRDRLDAESGLITRTEKSVLFVVPHDRYWLIGSTDTDWDLNKAHPAATATDIDYLLGQANRLLRRPLTRDDIIGVYAGLRPLLAGKSSTTAKLSRDHSVTHPVPGLVTVAGGKYTTYRVMAADAVDEAARELGEVPPSITDRVPLAGAEGYPALRRRVRELADELGTTEETVERLLGRYGDLLPELRELIATDPALAEPLPGGPGYLRAEIVYAATHEDARHLDDILTRRTHISIEERDRGRAAATPAAELAGRALGWTDDRIREEVAAYTARVEAELRSQEQPDDTTADRVRRSAAELLPVP
ncbi:FAD-dependent oxidoreductase [Longimycelium tulufanense]|uniref:Glycerol-3-phosphate dehydrogenase n=1 Tax=Longimycelium tulufanense TaxID=907463 RepID=A0A8J3CD43_9PSEU|nr:glycerol-3-phosphate dehydrogenase/oxidase [Longimycelium tulufanense]GGM49855.1 FAD-dependent oxidoreductase [Longimycelium tulufanense]